MVRQDSDLPPPDAPRDAAAPPGGAPPAPESGGSPADPAPAADPTRRAAPLELPDLFRFRQPGTRRSAVMRVLRGVTGVLLILLGVVVWITPVIGGAPLLYLAGGSLLATSHPRIARWLNRHERRLPYKARLLLRPQLWKKARAAQRDAAEPKP